MICKLFFSTIGHTITVKRNSKSLVSASRLQTERDKLFAENQEKLINIMEGVQNTLLRLTCNLDMRRDVNIGVYFPIKSLATLKKFLDKSDGQFELRRDEFEDQLYNTVTNNIKLKRPFESNLLATVFSREFMSSHKWPGPRYITKIL